MSRMGTEFKVGLFTILGLAATAIAIFFVSPEIFNRKAKTEYYTTLKDASGILESTHVKTNGVTIGRVSKVQLVENNTRVELEILSEVSIPEGSVITVRTVGFLGDKFIDVVRPDKGGQPIPADGYIPRSPDSGDITEVVRQVGSIATDIKKVTENLAAVLGDKSGEERMNRIVANVEKITENTNTILADNRQDIRELVANFRDVSASLKEVAGPENRQRLEAILAKFEESMNDVRGASENVRLISERIEKGEGTIGRLINDDTALVEVETAVKEIRQVISPVNKLQIVVDTHAEARGDDSRQAYFNLHLFPRPDSYYTLGFTDLSDRVVDTRTETIDGDPADDSAVRIRETIRENRALRFNVQIAKRWRWFGARLGLLESTGGFAGDVYLFKDKVKISAEAFDFAEKDDEVRKIGHLKAYASVLFFDHLMAMGGIDDPTKLDPNTGKVRKKPSFFLGAGLTFNDQDLKSFFGLASLAGR